jgi:hypothetical protein
MFCCNIIGRQRDFLNFAEAASDRASHAFSIVPNGYKNYKTEAGYDGFFYGDKI